MYNRRCYAQQDSVERVSGWLLILYGTNELRARTAWVSAPYIYACSWFPVTHPIRTQTREKTV